MADITYDLEEPSDEEHPQAPTPRPPQEAPKPLPRLVRFSDPAPAPGPPSRAERLKARAETKERETAAKPKAKPAASPPPKNKPRSVDPETGEKRILEEETPELDTYETRGEIRIAIGLVVVVVLVGVLIRLLIGSMGSGSSEQYDTAELAPADPVGVPGQAPVGGTAKGASPASESEARLVLNDARAYAKKNDAENTLKRLQDVTTKYPKSQAAKEAQAALDRGNQGLPLFVDVPLVLANKVEPPPKPEPEPEPTVTAVRPNSTLPTGRARVELTPPPVTPEPFHATGLVKDTANAQPHALPEGFRPRSEAGVHPSGWPNEITCDRDGAAMVFVPGGTFVMGRDNGAPEERPAHRVTLTPYYMDQHEITVRQYRLFLMSPDGAGRKLTPEAESDMERGDDWPMVRVNSRDAQDYAQWARKALPTEAQWEFAARTTDGRNHPWGQADPSWKDEDRAPGQTDPVMSFPLDMSPYGIFDLAGNVREWTADWFDSKYYQSLQSNANAAVDPKGPAQPKTRGTHVVIKGGSPRWESSWRADMRPEAKVSDLGFRCTLNLNAALIASPAEIGPAPAPGAPATQPAPARNPSGLTPF